MSVVKAVPERQDPPPVSGAWRPGDPLGSRRFHTVTEGRPFSLEAGGTLEHVEVAYEVVGELAPGADNAILVCHALTGDSHVAGPAGPGHPTPGWWDVLVGPGKAIDTDRFAVVCANVLGGCQGSTGPASIDPATGRPHGSSFPIVTIRDMVRTQASLADHLGVRTWRAVIGGSMGGMQALEWAVMYPERVGRLVVASSAAQASALQIAWSHVGRSAILADPGFLGGDYYGLVDGEGPHRGLAVARMAAQVTYRSDDLFRERFHRALLGTDEFAEGNVFDIEGYLDYHGAKLVRRFDANSYLRLNRAMDLHDLARRRGGVHGALSRVLAPSLVLAISSDALYPLSQQRELHEALVDGPGSNRWVLIDSPHGHDGFLIESGRLGREVAAFLDDLDSEGTRP